MTKKELPILRRAYRQIVDDRKYFLEGQTVGASSRIADLDAEDMPEFARLDRMCVELKALIEAHRV